MIDTEYDICEDLMREFYVAINDQEVGCVRQIVVRNVYKQARVTLRPVTLDHQAMRELPQAMQKLTEQADIWNRDWMKEIA